MRISDWSSDVCSSDLAICERVPSVEMVRLVSSGTEATMSAVRVARGHTGRDVVVKLDRKSVVSGQSVSVRVALGGSRIINKKISRQYMMRPLYNSTNRQPTQY